MEEAAPARENERNAAPTAPAAVHERHEAADMRRLQAQQGHIHLRGKARELFQVECVERDGARGQAFFHAHMLQVAQGFGRQRRGGVGHTLPKQELTALFHQWFQSKIH